MSEEELIWPGDPRHPCDICGRRSAALHCMPCAPVPLSQAYSGPSATPQLTEQQYQWLSNEGFGSGPVDPDIQLLADMGLVEINMKPWKIEGHQAWSWGPTEAGAKLGPYPGRYGQLEIEGEA